MNSRERVLAAINHQPFDRVPTDIWATGEVMQKLAAHFGSWENITRELHIDGIAGLGARYIGPPIPDGCDEWGNKSAPIQYETGVYWEQCSHALAHVKTIDDAVAFNWPQAAWWDVGEMRGQALERRKLQAVTCGYMAPFYFHNKLRGLEQSFIDPHEDPELTHFILGKITDYFVAHHRRMFEACEGLIDICQVTDDLGCQTGPLISLETYREFYKPHHVRCCELCKEFGIKIFHHDDGSCREFLPDLIEIGIGILNPVQWNCPGMETKALKRDFGGAVCFHGGIDNQNILPFGTPEDVRAEVRHCTDDLAGDGTGYILAPCHNLQSNTPLENILAMYDEAWNYGRR